MLVSRVRVRKRSSSLSTAGGWSSSPRSRSWVAVQALVGLCVLAVVSTGCQSNPKPPPLESASSSSATPTPSPTEAAPTLPAEAKGTSEAAAKAFVRHYVALVNHAMATGDTEPLVAASHPGCGSCNAVVERIDSVYAAGGSIDSDGWRILSVQPVPKQPKTHPVLDVGLLMSPQRVKTSESATPKTFEGGRLPATFRIARSHSDWQLVDWERAA